MKNITLSIDDEILENARVIAAEKRTTVNAMVREYLTEVAGRDARLARARRELLNMMDTSKGRMKPGWKFSREETYER